MGTYLILDNIRTKVYGNKIRARSYSLLTTASVFPQTRGSVIRAETLRIPPLSLESNVPTPPGSVQKGMIIHPASLEGRTTIHIANKSEPFKSNVLMQVMLFCICKLCSIWNIQYGQPCLRRVKYLAIWGMTVRCPLLKLS